MPAPFGPTRPTRSPRWMRVEKSLDHGELAEALLDALRLDHQLAGFGGVARPPWSPCLRRRDGRGNAGAWSAARRAGACCACAARSRRSAASAPRARSGGRACAGRALPPPAPVSRHVLEMGKALVEAAGLAAIEPDGGARDALEEAAVVRDDDQRRARCGRAPLPAIRWPTGRDGWSARQAAGCRARRQDAGQRGAAGLAARQLGRDSLAGEAEMLHQIGGAVGIVARARAPPRHRRATVGKAVDVGLLRQIADGRRRLAEDGRRPAARSGRRRSSAASICRSRCGRPARSCRRPTPTARHRRAAACRRRSGNIPSRLRRGGAMSAFG